MPNLNIEKAIYITFNSETHESNYNLYGDINEKSEIKAKLIIFKEDGVAIDANCNFHNVIFTLFRL